MKKYWLCFLLVLTFITGFSQTNPLDISISIKISDKSIKYVLNEITTKYAIEFSYSSNIISVSKIVSLSVNNEPLSEVLKKLFPQKDIVFIEAENKVIITRDNKGESNTSPVLYTINGIVMDSTTKEPIPYAHIILDSSFHAISSYNGTFSIDKVSTGKHFLTVNMIGYSPQFLRVNITDKSITNEIHLSPSIITLEEAVVTADPVIDRTAVSDMSLNKTELEANKGLINDPLRTITSLTGISSKGNLFGGGQIFVRGGDANETSYYLDNAFTPWPWYFIGKSVFNTETIEKAEVLTGGFPASYGNAMSGIINMIPKEGNMKVYGGSFAVGFYDMDATIEGPIKKDKISFLLSARRSYLDLLIPAAPPYFDFTHKITFRLNKKHKITFSGLNDLQNYQFSNMDSISDNAGNINSTRKASTETIQWQSMFSEKLYNKLSILYSSINSNNTIDRNYDLSLKGNIYGFRNDLTRFLSFKHKIKAGMEGYVLNYAYNGHAPLDPLETNPSDSSVILVNQNIATKTWSVGGYLLYEGYLTKRLKINTGIRADYQQLNTNLDLSPRFSAGYHLSDKVELRFATGFYYQPADPASAYYNPELKSNKSIQYIGGLKFSIGKHLTGWSELYYNAYYNGVVYDSLFNFSNSGYGYSKGISTILKKETGNISGWISYTYSHSKRRSSLQDTLYNFFFDRPHLVNILLKYEISKNSWILPKNIILDFRFASGTPYTPVSGASFNNAWIPEKGSLLSERNPNYHNLNLKVEWKLRSKKSRKFGFHYYFQIWNLYNQRNISNRTYRYGSQYVNNVKEIIHYDTPRIISIGLRLDLNRP